MEKGLVRIWILAALSLSLSLSTSGFAVAKTINQTPFMRGAISIDKLTRSFTVAHDSIHRALFGQITSAASLSYYDPNNTERYIVAAADPAWNRVLYAVEGDPIRTLPAFAGRALVGPSSLALAPLGILYVADTGNARVVMYIFASYSGPYAPQRTFFAHLAIPADGRFSLPHEVLWDDNGTTTDGNDDIIWILDRLNAKIAAYHIYYNAGSQSYYASPYVTLDVRAIGGNFESRPITFTKGRSFTTPSAGSSFCTTQLIVYDGGNNRFITYNIPRNTGEVSAGAVSYQTSPNPIAASYFTSLTTDPWGNILALDGRGSRICKLSASLVLLDTYGSFGSGPLGSEQMRQPKSLSFNQKMWQGATPPEMTSRCNLTELWGENTGVQALRMGIVSKDLVATLPAGANGMSVGFFSTDHAQTRVQVTEPGNGQVVRTVYDGLRAPGSQELMWDGRDDSGILASICHTYRVVVRSISLYAQPETSQVQVDVYYKPRVRNNLQLSSNIPGSVLSLDGAQYTYNGTSIAVPCSVCTSHTLGTAPTQTVAATRYCFGGWSNGGFRKQTVQVKGDSTISLNLTSYAGPTSVVAGATLYDDAYDCKSPYLFQGSATLTTSSPTDTFHTWGNVQFRMPKWPAQVSEKARLTIARPFVGKGLRFESVDSTSTSGVELWEGVRFAAGATSIVLDSCETRSASNGIATESATLSYAFITRSKFESNKNSDLSLGFDPLSSPVARITWSRFTDPMAVTISVGGTSLTPVGTAAITDNTFTNLGSNGSLRVIGGWQGPIEQNVFTVNKTGTAVKLLRYQTYASPAVYLYHNTFASFISPGWYALEAPALGGGVTQVDAQNNDWSYYTSDQIAQLIVHGGTRAIVAYQPWTPSGGGGGGGGGGGCPFVLSRTDNGYEVENSILGRSEVAGAMVEDACPLRSSVSRDGVVHLRVAELESDTDVIDRIGLGAVEVPNGYELSTDEGGHPVLVQWPDAPAEELARSPKISAFISPVAPGSAYSGMQGDSLDLRIPDSPGSTPGKRRIGINMIPKPPGVSTRPGAATGVIIRASTEREGDRWVTIGRLLPREHWSTETIGLGTLEGGVVRRLRLVWQSQHTLGRIGLVGTAEAKVTAVPALSARHSNGIDVSDAIRRSDRQTVTLRPGEHVDLAFDVRQVPTTSKLVLLAHGRYFPPGVEPTPEVPAVYFLGQNRPNPFNPHTTIEYGTPATAKVSIRIFDVSGRLVRTLVNQDLPAGFHRADWDGRSQSGSQVSSGIYFYELRTNSFSQKRRMILLR